MNSQYIIVYNKRKSEIIVTAVPLKHTTDTGGIWDHAKSRRKSVIN